ncbi:hypothetical protein ACP70R_001709 [Stipagrostis hirtigluma subsp. patula]
MTCLFVLSVAVAREKDDIVNEMHNAVKCESGHQQE